MNPGGHLPPFTPPPIPNGIMTIPTGHPHLWWTPDRIARARAWVQAHNYTPDSSDPTAQAFAYVATGNTTYAQNAIAWLRTVQSMRYLEDQDQTRWQGEHAILVYDWCYDQLTAADKMAIQPYFTTRIQAWETDQWGGPNRGHDDGNYYWGYTRNDLEWGFAVHDEDAA